MAWRYQIDIMRTLPDEFKINLAQPVLCNDLPFVTGTDPVVLTKHTFQIAAGKKHCSRSPFAADARFLPMMQTRPGKDKFAAHAAETALHGTVDPAIMRTVVTGCHGKITSGLLFAFYLQIFVIPIL